MLLALFPLAVPYLLNPVGIVGLITISARSSGFLIAAIAVQLVLDGMVQIGVLTSVPH